MVLEGPWAETCEGRPLLSFDNGEDVNILAFCSIDQHHITVCRHFVYAWDFLSLPNFLEPTLYNSMRNKLRFHEEQNSLSYQKFLMSWVLFWIQFFNRCHYYRLSIILFSRKHTCISRISYWLSIVFSIDWNSFHRKIHKLNLVANALWALSDTFVPIGNSAFTKSYRRGSMTHIVFEHRAPQKIITNQPTGVTFSYFHMYMLTIDLFWRVNL